MALLRRHAAPAAPEADGAGPTALAGRLIRVIFGCYFLVAVLLTGIQLALEYAHAREHLREDVAAMQRTFGPGLEDAMWRFNAEVLRGILSGIREIPAVIGVEVRDEHGVRIETIGLVGDDTRTNAIAPEGAFARLGTPFSRSFDLIHTDETGRRHRVGSWTVFSDTGIAIEQVRHTLVVILINSLIKTVMLWFIFAAVIRGMVGRPLAQIGAFVARLDGACPETRPLVLRAGGRHELHALVEALNTMMRRLRQSSDDNALLMRSLREMNATLQAKVAERTQELEVLATTDLLTGLFNRRKLDEALEAGVSRAAGEGAGLAVILGDIDQFKAINDQHGHKVGDAVLTAFADILRADRRPDDTVGRWGGEEFMLVCPGAGLAEAASVAETLRRRIETTQLPVVGLRTCSFGVAALRPGETADGLVARADAALYRAKRSGRNRVETNGLPREAA
ncbi:GGDEF domain-containing protein [Methylobacterium organophilum]|uniref:diguanylate cyclase n=1 Tax=Methylobacterium organophilum TaxID=410 RepID=A0ABQ4T7Q3_METOR|nr:GGDEF domain-containing protein [Methylobacterium organophilum]GJE26484.1 hypothetical protein LKMONMHP_1335 [Methylobacterium organophilum]